MRMRLIIFSTGFFCRRTGFVFLAFGEFNSTAAVASTFRNEVAVAEVKIKLFYFCFVLYFSCKILVADTLLCDSVFRMNILCMFGGD